MSIEECALYLDRNLDRDLLLHCICPTQDIIACAYADQIVCHRLQWQKLWTHLLIDHTAQPSALSWHPKAKCLAVGFTDGQLILLDLEKGTKVMGIDMQLAIKAIHWAQISVPQSTGQSQDLPSLRSARMTVSMVLLMSTHCLNRQALQVLLSCSNLRLSLHWQNLMTLLTKTTPCCVSAQANQ